MEHIYSYTNKSYNELEGFLIQDGYERIETRRAEFSKSYKKNSKNGEILYISTKENIEGNTDLNGIVIEVFEMNGGTEKLKSIVDKTTNPQWMVRKEITSAELKKVKCSSDRSGYFIYQSEKKIVL